MSEKNFEPAKKNYFFGDSYEDLGKTIKKAFELNTNSIYKGKQNIVSAWINGGIFKKIVSLAMNGISIIILLVFGTLYTLLFSVFHIGIVFALMVLFYIVFSVVWLIDRIYLLIHKVRTDCPVCHESALIPYYRCPSCGEIHRWLVPNKYGVWKHKCNCGEAIPSTFLNGRSKITAICPYCDSELVASEVRPVVFQLIGGSRAGKTVYLAAFYHEFINMIKEKKGIGLEITESYRPLFYDLERWFNGGECLSTTQLNSQMYPVIIDIGYGIKRQFSIYDIAGEMFKGDIINSETLQKQFQYCDGLIFVIDPYSSEKMRPKNSGNSDIHDYSEISANSVATNFINYFIHTKYVNATKQSNKKMAVIITKADIDEVKEEIGQAKIDAVYFANGGQYKSKEECRNQICRQYLINIGFSSAVNDLEIHFSRIQYYPVSAMGHSQNGTKYKSWGIMEPLEWMLSDVDKVLADKIGI